LAYLLPFLKNNITFFYYLNTITTQKPHMGNTEN